MNIDPTAIISHDAQLADDVSVGAYSVIGAEVRIGAGTVIGPHVVINGPTTIGNDNRFFQFASIGEEPQDKKYHGESSVLEIGNNNTIREFVTIHRGTEDGIGKTVIGNNNWLMAYIHIAHDCVIGNNTTFSNGASLAGHVTVDDHAILGGFSLIHQFCRIGQYAFCGMGSTVSKDIPPYVMVSGNPAHPHGINAEGLKRNDFEKETIRAIREAYKIIYRSGLKVDEAISKLEDLQPGEKAIAPLIELLQSSTRGILR